MLIYQLPSLFLAECRRTARLWWSYRLNAVSSLLVYAIVFPLLVLILQNIARQNGAVYGATERLLSLLGFLSWSLCMRTLATIPDMVEEEAGVGTLENVMIAPVPFGVTLALRMGAVCLRYALETILLAVALSFLLQVTFTITPLALLVLFLTLVGTCGVGFALAGLALVYKSVGSITSVLTTLALLISGALVPINSLGLLFNLLKYIFPTTWGIDLLREVVVRGYGFSVFARDLAGLGLQTAIFVLVGILLLAINLERARAQGSLAAY